MKKQSWIAARLAVLVMVLFACMAAVPVMADDDDEDPPQDQQRNKPRTDVPQEWSDPQVQGIVEQVWWSESKIPNYQTATMRVFSKESNLPIIVYGDDPSVRAALVEGRACAGRFVVVTGDRLDENTLIGRSIEVPNLDMPCTGTL